MSDVPGIVPMALDEPLAVIRERTTPSSLASKKRPREDDQEATEEEGRKKAPSSHSEKRARLTDTSDPPANPRSSLRGASFAAFLAMVDVWGAIGWFASLGELVTMGQVNQSLRTLYRTPEYVHSWMAHCGYVRPTEDGSERYGVDVLAWMNHFIFTPPWRNENGRWIRVSPHHACTLPMPSIPSMCQQGTYVRHIHALWTHGYVPIPSSVKHPGVALSRIGRVDMDVPVIPIPTWVPPAESSDPRRVRFELFPPGRHRKEWSMRYPGSRQPGCSVPISFAIWVTAVEFALQTIHRYYWKRWSDTLAVQWDDDYVTIMTTTDISRFTDDHNRDPEGIRWVQRRPVYTDRYLLQWPCLHLRSWCAGGRLNALTQWCTMS